VNVQKLDYYKDMKTMKKFLPPKLDREVVCIVSNEADLELVSRVSCYLNKPDTYISMFRLPRAEFLRKEDFSLSDDSYFSDVLASKASRLILNSIARINCRRVILIGLDEIQKSFLTLDRYYRAEFIEINTLTDIDEKLKYLNKTFNGFYYCKKIDILKGERKLFCVNGFYRQSVHPEALHGGVGMIG
jgi:hypothetical protein